MVRLESESEQHQMQLQDLHQQQQQQQQQQRRNEQLLLKSAIKPAKWQRALAATAMMVSLLLITGSIYLHLQQKSHLGRLHINVKHDANTDNNQYVITNRPTVVHFNQNDYGTEHSASVTYESEDDYNEQYEDADYVYPSASHGGVYDYLEVLTTQLDQSSDQTTLKTAMVGQIITELSGACLQCICESATGCKPVKCQNESCGIYGISQAYWQDAVSDSDIRTTYENCVNDAACSRHTIASYVHKYASDCNLDGIIDCRDHIALHILGPNGCLDKVDLPPIFKLRMNSCFLREGLFFS